MEVSVKWTLLFIVIKFTAFCSAQNTQQLVVTAGEDITLPCTVSSDYPTWTGPEISDGYTQIYNNPGQSSFPNPNVPKQKRARLDWDSDKSSLIIRDVIFSDQGLYQCAAVAKINLTVRVPPSSPVITHTETVDGTLIIRKSQSQNTTLVCISSGSYPQSTVEWYKGNTGTQPLTSTSSVNNGTNSYTVTQTYRFTPQRQDDGVKFICQSSFQTAPRHIATTRAELLLNLKPNHPTIVQTSVVSAGSQAAISCTTTGSRPAASIAWSYGNANPSGEETTTLDDVTKTYTVVSLLKVQVTAEDNGQTIKCKVTHILLVNPTQLTASVNLNVRFSVQASSTRLTGNREIEATGTTPLTLNCTTGSSNPASDIKWLNGSVEITNTRPYTTWTGTNNGQIRSQKLILYPTRYMDGDVIKCAVFNVLNSHSPELHTTTLNLRYSPMINPISDITVIEGDSAVFTCKASSKPVSTFKWYNGQSTLLKEGIGTIENNGLNFTMENVRRTDAMTYRCNANNGIETTDYKNVILTVNYPPDVKAIATNTTINTSRLMMTCNATGIPNTDYKYGKWFQRWPGYNTSLREYPEGKTLELENLTYEHSGFYFCSASNGIKVFGTKKEFIDGSVHLVVQSFPVMTNYSDKISAKLNENATFGVDYYSNVVKSDIKLYKKVNGSKEGKQLYEVSQTKVQVDLSVFNQTIKTSGTKARILIPMKSKNDFGVYDVVVSNEIGQVTRSFEIVPKGPPSMPTNVTLDGIQFNSVRITWIAGYHGGFPQTFVIQTSSDFVNWRNDSVNGGLTESTDPMSYILSHLSASTTYYVKLYAFNNEGSSKFTEVLNYTTSAEIDGGDGSGSSALIGGAAGGGVAVVVILVVLLVVFLIRKGTFTKGKAKSYHDHSDRKPVNEDDYGMQDNPMYVSAGPREHTAGVSESGDEVAVYSKVDKHSHVPSSNKTDVEGDKSRKTKEIGDIYENTSSTEPKKASAKQMKNDETIYENPEPKKNVKKDWLIYADLTFNDKPEGQKRLVIHGLDSKTEYVEVDFTKKADPLPDSDDENAPPNL